METDGSSKPYVPKGSEDLFQSEWSKRMKYFLYEVGTSNFPNHLYEDWDDPYCAKLDFERVIHSVGITSEGATQVENYFKFYDDKVNEWKPVERNINSAVFVNKDGSF